MITCLVTIMTRFYLMSLGETWWQVSWLGEHYHWPVTQLTHRFDLIEAWFPFQMKYIYIATTKFSPCHNSRKLWHKQNFVMIRWLGIQFRNDLNWIGSEHYLKDDSLYTCSPCITPSSKQWTLIHWTCGHVYWVLTYNITAVMKLKKTWSMEYILVVRNWFITLDS